MRTRRKAYGLWVTMLAGPGCAPAQDHAAVDFVVDDERRLFALREAAEARIDLGQLPHSAEQVCAFARGGLQLLFVTDGDGRIHHYVTDLERLLYLRSLPVNPDTDACAITRDGAYVYHLDPATGIWRSSTDPEAEIASEPVALYPPWGNLAPGTEVIDVAALSQEHAPADPALPQEPAPADPAIAIVPAAVETTAVRVHGDAADDVAILVNPLDPGRSLVLGTDKAEGGLHVYGLDGRELQFLPVGRLNNVNATVVGDGASAFGIAAASNRTRRRFDVFRIDLRTGRVALAGSQPLELADPYGLCLRKSDALEVVVGDTEGRVQRWSLAVGESGIQTALLAELRFDSQTEGCYVDDAVGVVYVGEEDVGVWRVPLETPGERRLMLAPTLDGLVPDVEGIALYARADERWLLVSSQGDDTLLVVDPEAGTIVRKLRVGLNFEAGIDGASETDGLDVTAAALPGFPDGLLVVQDGRNVAPPAPQNFKLVDWRRIGALLEGP